MSTQVCALTVAYDNQQELMRLLSSLKHQGDSLSGLIVIDNSEDCYSVENRKIFDLYSCEFTFARYLKAEDNIGSAGGFRRGMKIAHENGFSWVWLLDQDGAVSRGCLTELLRYSRAGDILCPNTVDIDQPTYSAPKVYTENIFGARYPVSWCSTSCQIHTFATHAVLVSKRALDTIGYYDDSFFFVGWEDTDYGYRAVQAGLVIFFVASAEAKHPIKRQNKILENAEGVATMALRGPQEQIRFLEPVFGRLYDDAAVGKGKWARTILRLQPCHLGYITDFNINEIRCSKTRSIAAFSQPYMESKHLRAWQYLLALTYTMGCALYRKIGEERGISLMVMLRTHLQCLARMLKGDWPYHSIEQLWREVLQYDVNRS
jgi:GT2 family glycosyltransferase